MSDAMVEELARSRPGRALLLRAYVLAVLSHGLVLLPPRRLERVLLAFRSSPAGEGVDEETVERVRAAVDHVQSSGWPFVGKGCLSRGVTLFILLRRLGLSVALAFGAGLEDDEPAAHCWLVRHDLPFLETVDPRSKFTEIWRLGVDDSR